MSADPFKESLAELERLTAELNKPRKVLLIEDDESFRQAVALMLEDRGVEITEAKDANEAAHFLSTIDFDLVITDFRLPGPSGVDIVRSIRKRDGEHPRVIVLTGYLNDPALCELTHIPGAATMVIAKPVTGDTLVTYVNLLTRR